MLVVVDARRLIVGRIGNLVRVVTQRRHESELIGRIGVVDERCEPAAAGLAVMEDVSGWRAEPEVAAIPVGAREVGKTLRVPAHARLCVGLVVVPGRQHKLGIVVALESGPGDDVEDRVRPIPVRRVISTAQRLELIHVLGIELRSDIARDVRVRNRHAINKPADLMATAHMQLVVCDVRSRYERRDGRKAVAQTRTGRLLNVLTADDRRRSTGVLTDLDLWR